MHGHLIPVKVGIEGRADLRVQKDRIAIDEHRLKCLDAQPVQSRRAIEQYQAPAHDLLQNIPERGMTTFNGASGLAQSRDDAIGQQFMDNEGLEKLQRHFLRQPTLVQLEVQSYGDYRAPGIIDALPQQIMPQPALFAAQNIGEAAQRAALRSNEGAAAVCIVK